MIQALLIGLFCAFVWKKFFRSGGFLQGFAGLLEKSVRGRRGPLALLTGREFIGGEHRGRAVTLLLHYKRGKRLGYLVVGMATSSPSRWQIGPRSIVHRLGGALAQLTGATADSPSLDLKVVVDGENQELQTRMSEPRIREALEALVRGHGMSLSLEQGWLAATWMPIGLFIFPGRFEQEKWREVLARMYRLVSELEGRHEDACAPT